MVRERSLISDFGEGSIVVPDSSLYLLVKRSTAKVGRNGQLYIDMDVTDGKESVNGKVWDVFGDIEDVLKSGNIVRVIEAKITRYQNARQIVVSDAVIATPEEIDSVCSGILPESESSYEELEKRFDDLVELLDENGRKVIDKFRENEKMWHLYTTIPAGRSLHHTYRRGLLEHSLNVAEIALKMCRQYENRYPVNTGLVVLASLLHDVGKIFEFQLNPATAIVERYSDRGKLLGHIYMGATWLEKLFSDIWQNDPELKMEFLHIILSHHGEYEFGSPKKPKTMEALIVSMADNLDANLDAVNIGINSDMDENWTKSIFMMQRAFYKNRNKME